MARERPRSIGSVDTSQATEGVLLTRMEEEGGYDAESEASFEQFREDLRSQNSGGTLWVHRLPLDDRGELIANAKGSLLFTAPIERYALEEVFAKVQTEYMAPTERRTCVRVTGSKKGERGLRFNRIVVVENPLRAPEKADPARESIAELLRALQDSQKATVTMVREMLTQHTPALPAPATPPIAQIRELAEVIFLLQGGKPAAAATPAAALAPPTVLDQLKTFRELRKFMGEFAGGAGEALEAAEDDGGNMLATLKHLSPWAALFTQMLARGGSPQRRIVHTIPPGNAGSNPAPGARPGQRAPVSAPAGLTIPGSDSAHAAGIAPVTPIQPNPAPASPGEDDPVIAQMRDQFAALTQSAAEGADPAAAAAMILQMIPADSQAEAALLGFLEDEAGWFGKLCGIYPPAGAHQTWFAQLRGALLAEFPEEGAAGAVIPIE